MAKREFEQSIKNTLPKQGKEVKPMSKPPRIKSAKVIEVIEVKYIVYPENEKEPVTRITCYWSTEGKLLAKANK